VHGCWSPGPRPGGADATDPCLRGRRAAGARGAPAGAGSPAETPSEKARYEDGPDRRYLLGGRWLYRADPGDTGIANGFQRERTTRRWRPVSVPHAFNARDYSQRSLDGLVGWYRKDFRAPEVDRGFRWAFRSGGRV
jgi:hypothetical protein